MATTEAKTEHGDDHDHDHDHDDDHAAAPKKRSSLTKPDESERAHGHDHGDKSLPHHAAHGASKKEIWTVFFILCGLTALELGVVYLHIGRKALYAALIGLALAKAYAVAMYYMHLKGETKIMKVMIYFPLVFPPLYAVILMLEAVFRLLGAPGS
ncbi:MAG: hypothetical protein NVSMB47_02260 [Polyangiales bacterium]